MEMNEAERLEFGLAVARVVRRVYGGEKKAAYTAAEVNSGTFDRVLKGLTVKTGTVVAVVTTFWPWADGDWKRVLDEADTRQPADPTAEALKQLEERVANLERVVAVSVPTVKGGATIPPPTVTDSSKGFSLQELGGEPSPQPQHAGDDLGRSR